jgi:hypothetical protein
MHQVVLIVRFFLDVIGEEERELAKKNWANIQRRQSDEKTDCSEQAQRDGRAMPL